MKILIVEDSATLRYSMKRLIEEIGHNTLFAHSGEEALQMVGVNDFDMVIMDVEMPGLNGFETTSLMREALDGRWVPIIFATSYASEARVLEGIEAGGDDYLVKPLTRVLLEAKIKAMHRISAMHLQLTRLNAELAGLSQRDGLTQLLNRNTFLEKAAQSIIEGRRHIKPCALMMLDVDFFKQYNDRYGHVSGDECLWEIARTLQNTVIRESDLVGRYGGEEFIIMLPQTDQQGAILVAEKIIRAVEGLAIVHSGSTVADVVTISVGIDITVLGNQDSLETLILAADKNLYLAKEQGRNRLMVTEEVHRTFLIAGSDASQLNMLTEMLQPLGNIITADNQSECLELAKDILPDVIILDGDSQGMDCRLIDKRLKQAVRTARTSVLLVSSNPDVSKTADAVSARCGDSLRERVLALME